MGGGVQKVPFPLDKRLWHPSLLPGHIVLVSTTEPGGQVDIAPKSWVTMVAARIPIVAFGCNTAHATYQNICASGAFVINIPDASLAERIWKLPDHHGEERIRQSGFSLAPSQQVEAPIVADCAGHLECIYDSEKRYADEVMIFGRIVAASIDADCLESGPPQQYFRLRPAFFLEGGLFGMLDTAYRVGSLPPTNLPLFVIEPGEPTNAHDGSAVLKEHLSYLDQLRTTGRLLMAGAFGADAQHSASAAGGATPPGGGMYVVNASSLEEAAALAKEDPMVRAGASFSVRAWRRSF